MGFPHDEEVRKEALSEVSCLTVDAMLALKVQDASFPPLESETYYIFRTSRQGSLWFSIFQNVCYGVHSVDCLREKEIFGKTKNNIGKNLVKKNKSYIYLRKHLVDLMFHSMLCGTNSSGYVKGRIKILKNYFFLDFIKELLLIPLQKSTN